MLIAFDLVAYVPPAGSKEMNTARLNGPYSFLAASYLLFILALSIGWRLLPFHMCKVLCCIYPNRR